MTNTPPNKPARPKIGRWIVLGAAILLVGSMFIGKASVARLLRSQGDIHKKEQAVKQLRLEVDSLKQKNAQLKNDTSYIERIGREKLGMARKDETVYKFIGKDR
jgi:cell division protein FtsB